MRVLIYENREGGKRYDRQLIDLYDCYREDRTLLLSPTHFQLAIGDASAPTVTQ